MVMTVIKGEIDVMFNSLTYLIAAIVTFTILIIPSGIILRCLGHSEWWSSLLLIPGILERLRTNA